MKRRTRLFHKAKLKESLSPKIMAFLLSGKMAFLPWYWSQKGFFKLFFNISIWQYQIHLMFHFVWIFPVQHIPVLKHQVILLWRMVTYIAAIAQLRHLRCRDIVFPEPTVVRASLKCGSDSHAKVLICLQAPGYWEKPRPAQMMDLEYIELCIMKLKGLFHRKAQGNAFSCTVLTDGLTASDLQVWCCLGWSNSHISQTRPFHESCSYIPFQSHSQKCQHHPGASTSVQ